MKRKNYVVAIVAVFGLLGTACTSTQGADHAAALLHETEIQVPTNNVTAESASFVEESTTASGYTQCSGMPGDELVADLDGDGSNDSILYDHDGATYEPSSSLSLTINGTDFTSILKTEDFSELYNSYDLPYYIVDLDTSDSYYDIAIQDDRASDDYITYFLRYDGSQVIFLGKVYDSISQYIPAAPIHLNGDGTLTSIFIPHINDLGVIFVQQTYVLENQKLDLQQQDLYPIDNSALNEQYRLHDVLQDITVYSSPDSLEPIVLPAGTTTITFEATDTTNWILLTDNQGKSYYLSIADLVQLETACNGDPVFSNLLWAD